MSDEFEKLIKGFREEKPITASEKVREAAISAAMAAFEEKKVSAPQGIGALDRLKNTGNILLETFKRRRSMRLSYSLAGGVSLTVLTLAVLNTSYFQARYPYFQSQPQPLENRQVNAGDNRVIVRHDRNVSAAALRRMNKAKTAQKEMPKPARPDFEERSFDAASPRLEPAAPALKKHNYQSKRPMAQSAVPLSGIISHLGGKAKRGPVMAFKNPAEHGAPFQYRDQGRDRFTTFKPIPVKLVSKTPVSTFSIDVDTASYAFTRAALNRGVLPQKQAVRVEELINYFAYDYEGPTHKSAPFKTSVSVMPTPWNAKTKLLHIGIKGFEISSQAKPQSNLVFLLDTSGSMNAPNKLPLLRNAFKLLLSSLGPDDSVAIVTYAGSAGMVLSPTKVREKAKIISALDTLQAGGSTAGAEGIRQAYQLAEQNFTKSGINRVILATDGDFNVGITNPEELKSFVERKRKSGVFLSVLGFGSGNYNDALMQTLAQNGNGNAAYIDNLNEARKVLVSEAGSTLFTIAKDVKIQVEFNPQTLSEYRLIGYESRMLNREDFNNDKVDAGDIGSGHSITAIYEITPRDSGARLIDDLRYGKTAAMPEASSSDEYAFVKIRYKLPKSKTSILMTTKVDKSAETGSISAAPRAARFAASVAAFGQLLRGGRYTGTYGYDDVIELALGARGPDRFGYRAEFINLVRLARSAAAMKSLK